MCADEAAGESGEGRVWRRRLRPGLMCRWESWSVPVRAMMSGVQGEGEAARVEGEAWGWVGTRQVRGASEWM